METIVVLLEEWIIQLTGPADLTPSEVDALRLLVRQSLDEWWSALGPLDVLGRAQLRIEP